MNKIDKLLRLSETGSSHREILEYLFIEVLKRYDCIENYHECYSVFIPESRCEYMFNKDMLSFQFDVLELLGELSRQDNIRFLYTLSKQSVSITFDLENIHKLLEA